MQAIRVGVTNALSAKHLARKRFLCNGALRFRLASGTGVAGRCARCRLLKEVRVYSPTRVNRERFVEKTRSKNTGALARRSSTPEEAAKGADIVALTTNAARIRSFPFFVDF